MTTWEYKTVYRSRGWDVDKPGDPKNSWMAGTDWDIDIEKKLKELGEEGWELVAVTPRSGYLGGKWSGYVSVDFAGFTSEELWVFKREKSK